MRPADRRLAIGNKAGNDQRGSGPDVTRLDRGTGEPFDAMQHDVMAIDPRLRTEAGELLNGAKARLEDVLGNHRAAAGHRVVDEGEGLQVGRKPWVGQGGDVERRWTPRCCHPEPAISHRDVRTSIGQQVQGRAHVCRHRTDHFHVTTGRGSGERPGTCRDTVGHHLVGDGVQGADALHHDHRCSGALDPGTHLGQERGDVDDLRLARSVCHGGPAVGQHRGHQDVLGSADAGEAQPDVATMQSMRRLGDEVPVVDVHRGPQRLEPGGVHVQAARSDRVTARDRNVRPAAPGYQRAEHADGGSQCPDQLVVGAVHDRLGDIELDDPGLRIVVNGAPEASQQLGHDRHVNDCRHIAQPRPAHRQQGPRHQLQSAVLGPDDRHLSPEAGATDHTKPLHHQRELTGAESERISSMVNLTRIYTRTGDDGTTALGDFSRTTKTDPRLVAYADTDEANSAIGVAVTCGQVREDVRGVLVRVQNDLFDVGADLCTPLAATYEYPPLRVKDVWVDELEADCDRFNGELEKLRSFILPGGTPGSAYLHVARTVTRRAERSAWTALQTYGDQAAPEGSPKGVGGINPLTAKYLNRLSDLLFILGRVANLPIGGDMLWQPGGGRAPGAGENRPAPTS